MTIILSKRGSHTKYLLFLSGQNNPPTNEEAPTLVLNCYGMGYSSTVCRPGKISRPWRNKKYSINRHSVLVSIPKLVWTLNFDFHNFSQNLTVLKKNILEFLIVKMICSRYRSRFCITPFLSLPEFRFVDSKSADILDFLQDRANFIRQEGNVFDIRMRWVLKLKT